MSATPSLHPSLQTAGLPLPGPAETSRSVRPTSVRRFWISEGMAQAKSEFQGVAFSHKEFPGCYGPASLSRHDLSRKVGRVAIRLPPRPAVAEPPGPAPPRPRPRPPWPPLRARSAQRGRPPGSGRTGLRASGETTDRQVRRHRRLALPALGRSLRPALCGTRGLAPSGPRNAGKHDISGLESEPNAGIQNNTGRSPPHTNATEAGTIRFQL